MKKNKEADIAEAEKNPNSGHYYKRLGNDCFIKEQYQKAIDYYDKAIVIYSSRLKFNYFCFLFRN